MGATTNRALLGRALLGALRRALPSVTFALSGIGATACGHCGIEFQEGPTDMGGALIDSSVLYDGSPRDGSAADASFSSCTVGKGQHTTVQSALDDPGCPVVTVPAGTYREHLIVSRAVEVVGAGAGVTILDGSDLGRVLEVRAAADIFLHEMSVTRGLSAEGAGIDMNGPVRLENIRIHDNHATGQRVLGAGIAVRNVGLAIGSGVEIDSNTAEVSGSGVDLSAVGGGLYAEGSAARIDVSFAVLIHDNRVTATQGDQAAEALGGGIALRDGAAFESLAAEVTLADNEARIVSATGTSANAVARGGGADCDGSTFRVNAGSFERNGSYSDTSSNPKARAFGGGIAAQDCVVAVQAIAIHENVARATCTDCTIESAGGGVYLVSSTNSISGSIVDANRAEFAHASGGGIAGSIGGGLYLRGGTTVVSGSTVSNNEVTGTIAEGPALGYGGGVAVDGHSIAPTTVEVFGSTIGPGNHVETFSGLGGSFQLGGGLILGNFLGESEGEATMTMVNSTISGNVLDTTSGAGFLIGAGLAVDASAEPLVATLIHTTVTENQARTASGVGGGIASVATTNEFIVLQNTLVHGNTASAANSANCHSPDSSVRLRGRNFVGGHAGSECPVEFSVGAALVPLTDPQFGPLQDNGGGTFTHAISPTSNARDRAREADCVDASGTPLTLDQRGSARSDCDSGAFEVQ